MKKETKQRKRGLASDVSDLLKLDRIIGNGKSKRPIEEADCDFSESSSYPNLFILFLQQAQKIPFFGILFF